MTEQTTVRSLTFADIEAGYANPEWRGWGYLGERNHAVRNETGHRTSVEAADSVLLDIANNKGWTSIQFFAWLNSRGGQHYGEMALWGLPAKEIRDIAARRNISVADLGV